MKCFFWVTKNVICSLCYKCFRTQDILGFKESRIFQRYGFEIADDDAWKWITQFSDLFKENCLGRKTVTSFATLKINRWRLLCKLDKFLLHFLCKYNDNSECFIICKRFVGHKIKILGSFSTGYIYWYWCKVIKAHIHINIILGIGTRHINKVGLYVRGV